MQEIAKMSEMELTEHVEKIIDHAEKENMMHIFSPMFEDLEHENSELKTELEISRKIIESTIDDLEQVLNKLNDIP